MTECKEIIKIGNSKGIIIPMEFLEQLNLTYKDIVRLDIELDDKGNYMKISKIIIKKDY